MSSLQTKGSSHSEVSWQLSPFLEVGSPPQSIKGMAKSGRNRAKSRVHRRRSVFMKILPRFFKVNNNKIKMSVKKNPKKKEGSSIFDSIII